MRLRPDVSILSLNYPPEPTGIAPYTGALAKGLSNEGYRVIAHVAQPHYPEWRIRDGYSQWYRAERLDGVPVHRRLHYVSRSPRGIRRLISELTFGTRLLFANWSRPRVVIAVSPSLFATGLIALRLRFTRRRPRLIIWVQDIYSLGLAETGQGGGVAQWITRQVESRTLRAADRVVAIHPRFADFLVQELDIDALRVIVVRNWTHLPQLDPVDGMVARSTLGWPADATLAVHTGNMGAKQGLENIVDAARLADARGLPVHFLLVGDGGERRRLEDRSRGISRLTFIDPLSDADYRLALRAADVLIVNEKPGVSAMAVPSKLTSYFDASRPIVAATDPGGITATEIAAADAGVVVRAGRPAALLNAVLKVAGDAEAALRLGSNGRNYRDAVLAENVAIEQWSKLVADVIQTCETP